MGEKYDRQMAMINELMRGGHTAYGDLARRYRVSVKTIKIE